MCITFNILLNHLFKEGTSLWLPLYTLSWLQLLQTAMHGGMRQHRQTSGQLTKTEKGRQVKLDALFNYMMIFWHPITRINYKEYSLKKERA